MATRFPALEIVLLDFQIPGIRDRLVTLQLGSTFGIFPDVDFLTVSFREKWIAPTRWKRSDAPFHTGHLTIDLQFELSGL